MRKRTSEQRRLSQGRGSGYGVGYRPWIDVWDGSGSQGWNRIVTGRKIARQYHFLSEPEFLAFYLFQDDDDCVDVREQYPLKKSETIAIARELHVRHPRDEDGRTRVMTTDFLLTYGSAANCERAVQVKEKVALEDENVLARLEIDRIWHTRHNRGWALMTENETKVPRAYNLARFDEYWDYDTTKRSARPIPEIEEAVYDLLQASPETALQDVCAECDRRLALDDGAALATVQHLLARKRWRVNMDELFKPKNILRGLTISIASTGGLNGKPLR